MEGHSHAVPRVVSLISSLLQRVADHNDAAAASSSSRGPKKITVTASAFEGTSKPVISVRSYLERIFRYANCSSSCYVAAYIYLDRFLRRSPSVAVDSFNVHRFIITSILVAVKFMDDMWDLNAHVSILQRTVLKDLVVTHIFFQHTLIWQMLQQFVLCKSGRDQLGGDELHGSGVLVWGWLRTSCDSDRLHFLLLRFTSSGVCRLPAGSSEVARRLVGRRRRYQQLPAVLLEISNGSMCGLNIVLSLCLPLTYLISYCCVIDLLMIMCILHFQSF